MIDNPSLYHHYHVSRIRSSLPDSTPPSSQAMSDDSDLEHHPSSKRRRLDSDEESNRYSSPDELAASSDHERSFHPRTNSLPRQQLNGDPIRRRSYKDSASDDSPDELDHTIHTFYRDGWSRSQHQSRDAPSNPSPVVTPRILTPPPRKEEEPRYVRYKQKMILRGHRRGVAAVRFSPDGRCIASCCEY